MIKPLYRQDLKQIFDKSDCPSIFKSSTPFDISLETLKPIHTSAQESIQAIKSISVALVHLRLTMLMPCQLKPSYIVRVGKQWGLRYAVCSRDTQQLQKGEDTYNTQEYQYHQDAQKELIWNLGLIWMRFFTTQTISIRKTPQEEIDALIERVVPKKDIQVTILHMLAHNNNKRLNFEEFLACEPLSSEQDIEAMMTQTAQGYPVEAFPSSRKLYSSLVIHMKNNSSFRGSRRADTLPVTPFTRELYYRQFRQFLDIDRFMQNVKDSLKTEYYNSDEAQKAACDFSFYIISLQNYINMSEINSKRIEIEARFDEVADRIYYANFSKRLFSLKDFLTHKQKVLVKNRYLDPKFHKYFEDPDNIDTVMVYSQFKQCLNQYADHLKRCLSQNKADIIALRLLVKIFIARTSSYVFLQYRQEVFQPFLEGCSTFNIKKVLARINQCNQMGSLNTLLRNIKKFYFSE